MRFLRYLRDLRDGLVNAHPILYYTVCWGSWVAFCLIVIYATSGN